MKNTKVKLLILCITLIPFLLPAQMPFQHLSAYNQQTSLETGIFSDVECLDYLGIGNSSVVAIGTNAGSPNEGIYSIFDADGHPLYYKEFQNSNPVIAEGIAELPNNNIVLTFYDPIANATDLVVIFNNGIIDWQIRLPNFHVRDVYANAASFYSGGQGIWLTGEKTGSGGHVAIAAFNGSGSLQFFQEYTVSSHNSSVGNAIHYDDNFNQIVVVGKADPIGTSGTSMFAMRLTPTGFMTFARRYVGAASDDRYNATALIPNPTANSNYAVAYEYAPANSPFDQIGIMNLDWTLFPTWDHTYQGIDFFSGNQYRNTGIEAVGNSFIACGSFNSKFHPLQPSGYALAVNMQGLSPKMNEYEMSSYYPSEGCSLEGISLNPNNGLPYMVGTFQTQPGGNSWPSGNDPRSFWLMRTTAFAEGYCSTSGQTQPFTSNTSDVFDFFFQSPMPTPVTSPLTSSVEDPVAIPQCSFPKQSFIGSLGLESATDVQTYFLSDQEQIIVEIPSDEERIGQTELLDLQGRVLMTATAKAGKQAMDTHMLSKGIYLVRTNIPGRPVSVKKVMVQ